METISRNQLLLLLMVCCSQLATGLELPDYAECCHYCKGEEHLWATVRPSWNLTLQDGAAEYITSFSNPSAYLVQDEIQAVVSLYEREYLIQYAGAPVRIDFNALSQSAAILNSQFVELDLGTSMDVAGVSVQGGFYQEPNDELLDRRESWLTEFIVSYATSPGTFQYVTGHNGIEVYSAQTGSMDISLADFGEVVTTQYIRVHPLGALDENGSTNKALFRTSAIICTMDTCNYPRLNCVPDDWSSWSGCQCRWDGCRQTRHRGVMRYESCGGVPCGATTETKLCSSSEPIWKTVLMWVGIALLLLTILLVAIYLAYRRYKKKNKKEAAFDKDTKPKKQKKKEKTNRELRNDRTDVKEENLDGVEDGNDLAEKKLAPETSSGVAGGVAAGGGAGAGAAAVAGGAAASRKKKNNNKDVESHPNGLYDDKKEAGLAPEPVEPEQAESDVGRSDPWGRPRPKGRAAAPAAAAGQSTLPPIQTTSSRKTPRDDPFF